MNVIPFAQYFTREDAKQAARRIYARDGRPVKVIALGGFWLLAVSAVRP